MIDEAASTEVELTSDPNSASKSDRFLKSFAAVSFLGVGLALYSIALPHFQSGDKLNLVIFLSGIGLLIFGMIGPRMRSLNYGPWKVNLEETKKELKTLRESIVHEVSGTIVELAENGSEQMDHEEAFELAMRILNHHIENNEGREIELRLISVGLCYTWPWIKKDFIAFAKNHPEIEFRWKIALVDYDYLSRFDLDSKNYDWIKQSSEIEREIEEMIEELVSDGYSNIHFEVFPYEMIPQWHGLLIDRKHLLIGRSDWDLVTPSGKPRLTVGSNQYRYYNHNRPSGYRRVNLFRHWFGFYVRQTKCMSLNTPETTESANKTRHSSPDRAESN